MKRGKSILILLGSAFLLLPSMTLAAVVTITGLVKNVANVVWIVATILVLIFWVITGILFLAALGSAEKLSTAKKALFASIAGTVVVILAWSVVTILQNAIFLGQ